jgi:hypothetical protein
VRRTFKAVAWLALAYSVYLNCHYLRHPPPMPSPSNPQAAALDRLDAAVLDDEQERLPPAEPPEPEVTLADLKRFPPPEVAKARLAEAEAAVARTEAAVKDINEKIREATSSREFDELVRARDELRRQARERASERAHYNTAWYHLASAYGLTAPSWKNPVGPDPRHLRELRKVLGRVAYREGWMPAPPAGP